MNQTGSKDEEDLAAAKLQGLFRQRKARAQVVKLGRLNIERVYDPTTRTYFYHNTKTGESSWEKPKLFQGLGEDSFLTPRSRQMFVKQEEKRQRGELRRAQDMTDEEAAKFIQGLFRVRVARKRIRDLIASVYMKSFDEEGNAFYYNTKTGVSSWEKPKLLGSADLDDNYVDEYANGHVQSVLAVEKEEKYSYENGPTTAEFKEEKLSHIETPEEVEARVKRRQDEGAKQVAAFLKHFDLSTLLDTLLEEGFDDMDAVCAMQESDLEEMGIKKRFREPLYNAVLEFKKQHGVKVPFEGYSGESSSDELEENDKVEEEEEEEEEEDVDNAEIDDGDIDASSEIDARSRADSSRSNQRAHQEEGESKLDTGDDKRKDRAKEKVSFDSEIEESDDESKYEDEESDDDSVRQVDEIIGVSVERVFEGDGENFPRKGEFALVHYVASLEDGTVFQSSRKMGRPFDFLVGAGHVIPGLDKAIRKMSRGERSILTIAPEMAYGAKGRTPLVPPNATLRFEVELIDNYYAPVGELLLDDSASESDQSDTN